MSAKCKFSLKFLPLAYTMWLQVGESKDAMKQWINDTFDKASVDEIIRLIIGGDPGKGSSPGKSSKIEIPSLARPIISSEEDEISIDSLFVGRSDLRMQMEQRFTEDIVARTVFNLSANNGKGEFLNFTEKDEETGLSIGNKNIMLYKNQLIKDLCDEMGETAPILTANMTAREYDGTIKETLRKYRNYIVDKTDVKAYNSFAILQNFDSLLKAKAGYITFNEDMVLDFADKYTYKGPNVEHYTGFMSSESAQIENQESDLAKILLNVMPEVNTEGKSISGTFIGLSGFNSVMTSLKKALLYSPKSFNEAARKTYYDGLDINMSALIDDYIKLLTDPSSTLPENHRNFLISKLRGIQKYIYQSELDRDIKDMFTQMFFKTEPTSYRVYSYDSELEEMSGRNLASNVSNNQKFALEDAIRGATYFLRTNSAAKKVLKDTYNIKVSGGNITITIPNTNESIEFKLAKNKNRFIYSGNISDEHLSQLVLDVLGTLVPDTYKSVGIQVDGYNFKLLNDFVTPLGIVLSSVFGSNFSGRNNVVDLKNYSASLLNTAKKFGIIYGDETKNVVKSPSGNNLPVYQLTNMTYNTMSILDDIKNWIPDNAGHTNPYSDSLFIENGELLVAPQIRNEVRIEDKVKSPEDLSVKELLQLSVLEDFYSPFIRDKIIYLQNATFADKSTHYLIGYDTSKTKFKLDDEITNIIKGESSENLIETIRMYRARRLEKIAANIVSDYKKAFLLNGKVIDRTVYTGFDENIDFNTLDGWDQFLRTAKLVNEDRSLTIDDVERVFHDAALEFKPEVHAYKPQKDVQSVIGKVRINETLLRQLHSSASGNAFKLRVNNARKQFIKSIEDNNWKWNKYDNPKMKKIWDDYQGKLGKEWFDTNSGDMYLTRNGKLHPILEAYFVTNMLLSNEYNAVTIGEVWAHPNKNKVLTNNDPEKGEIGTYSEFSEASRLIAQIKRSVAFGATYHPFAQNKNNGVTSDIDIAVMEDMPAFVQTPNGVESEVDSMDGSGIADALEARFENNSLIDARVGDNKKTIMMDVDKTYGTPILLKWAVYALTNEVRRNSYVSDASGEQLCRKMRSKYIRTIDNIGDYYNQKQDKIIYEDINTGERFKILNVGLALNGYTRQLIRVGQDGKEIGESFWRLLDDDVPGINQNTLYALDQLFGGAWTCKYENGAWNYTEENNDVLEEILSRKENQDLKKGFIAYAVNKSAIKVGAGEINKKATWKDDSILRTIRMSTKYGGVQMDADHELDLAQVTEMTQMISALIEDQHYSDLVKDVYEDIGKVVVAHMKKYDDKLQILKDPNATPEQKEEAKKRLYRILGESLVVAFSSGSKDTLGLAQAFVAKAAEAIKNNEDFLMPFSGATINGAFISQIASDINRGGIRHKYEGFAGVLNPSYNMIQYFRIYNEATGQYENMMLPQVAKVMREYNRTHLEDWTLERITREHGITADASGYYSINPFVIPTNVNEIDFEDTILVVNNGVVEEPIHIDSFAKYDSLKNRLRNNPNLAVFSWTAKGRNLRGADTRFTINGVEFSYYDLASVRASFYLNRFLKDGIDAFKEENTYQLDFLNTYLGNDWALNAKNLLISERNKTQKTLKSIETGKEFTFGNNVVRATSWRTRPPEIITGRYQGEKFGLTSNDNINDITSKDYFVNSLNAKYSGVTNSTVPESIYDIILYSGNKKFYVKIGNAESSYSKVDGISSNPDFVLNGNSIWYDNEEIASSTGKSFKTYTDETGQQYNLIAVDSIDRYNELMKSGIFDRQMIDYNAREDNLSMLMDISDIEADSVDDFDEKAEIRKDRNIQRKAERMFKSFKQSLLYVGARIPTQAMQSFMPMETIAWVNTDKNVVYVPAMQTYLEGSDYDIDKLYIMAHSVDSNGFVSSGSSLENYFSLDVTSRVSKPNGVKYSEGTGVQVTTTELQQVIGNREIDTIDAINLLNRIYNSGINTIEFVDDGTEPIDPRQFERDKKKFLRIINSHSDPDRDVKGNTLKNRLVNAIYNIASKPQNQLIAQVPVDMGEPQDAAKASTLGRAEMHINSDNPETIFMMQVQNMVGKKVIGISAVALKGFFAMSYVYSRKKEALKQAIFNGGGNLEIMQKLAALLITNPLTNEVTSIANLDVEDILDDLSNARMLTFDSQEASQIPEIIWGLFDRNYVDGHLVINLYDGLDKLRERVNRTDAALVISSIVSAATDNAKELILAKINATPELVDIYTTLTAIGVKFSDIAALMTSDELQFITKLGENNIFDESTERFKVKDAIQFYTGAGLLKIVDREALAGFVTRTYDKKDPNYQGVGSSNISNEKLLQILQNDDVVQAILKRTNNYIATYDSKKSTVDSNAEQAWRDEREARIENGENVPDFDFRFLPFTKERARNVVKFLELVHQRNEFRTQHPDSKIDNLLKILPTVEEFGDFSRMLGINQGLPTTLYKLRNIAKKLEDVNTHEIITFDTASALEQLPHFSKMLQTIDSIWDMVNEFSIKAKTTLSLADAVEKESSGQYSVTLNEDEFNALYDYVGDLLIARFLKESDFEFWVTPDAYMIRSYTGETSLPEQLRRIKLNSSDNIEVFKKWMDNYVIPRLKEKYAGNAFIDALRPMANITTRNGNTKVITGWRLPLQMMDIDKSPNTIQLYSEILAGFDAIANQESGIFGQNIGDLFYVYNMLLNKDSYGQHSFTRIFENLIQVNRDSIANQYNDWLSRIDYNGLISGEEVDGYGLLTELGGSTSEARYRIKNAVTNSDITSTISGNSNSILDLPVFYNIPIVPLITEEEIEVRKAKVEPAFKYAMDPTSIAIELSKRVQQVLGENTVHLITDEELEEFNSLPQYEMMKDSNGFIHDGEVYINISRCKGMPSGVLFHEFAHIVFAAMKNSKDTKTRAAYYTILGNVKNHSKFEEIAANYPGVVGSDLYEEVFVNLLQTYLEGKEYLPVDATDETDTAFTLSGFFNENPDTFINTISFLLGLNKGYVKSAKDIIGQDLDTIMTKFGYMMLHNEIQIDKTTVIDSQKQSTVKQNLYKDNKLTMKCENE